MQDTKVNRNAQYRPEQEQVLTTLYDKLKHHFGISLDKNTGYVTLRFNGFLTKNRKAKEKLFSVTMQIEDIDADGDQTHCDSCRNEFAPEELRPIEVESRYPAGKKHPIKSVRTLWMCVDCRCPQ